MSVETQLLADSKTATTTGEFPFEFLVESGLLFALNDQVLHKLGVALAINLDSEGKASGFNVWVDQEPWEYQEDTRAQGAQKFSDFIGALQVVNRDKTQATGE